MKKTLLLTLAALLLSPLAALQAEVPMRGDDPAQTGVFTINLSDIRVRDPFILAEDGTYYLYAQGGNRARKEILVRHEKIVGLPLWTVVSGQLSAWLRYAHSQDKLAYSELLGDLKSSTHRTDFGLGFWVPLAKQWHTGLNLEATSQKSNNALFNLKNSTIYVGLRWVNE
jgi:hypothetical protein